MEKVNELQEELAGARKIPWWIALLYLLIIAGTEVGLLLGSQPVWAMAVYGLMLISLLGLAAWKPENVLLYIGLAGVPIIRIVAYGTPLSGESLTVHLGVTGLVLLFYIFSAFRIPELAAERLLDLPQNWVNEIAIMLVGVLVGYLQFLVFPQPLSGYDNALAIGLLIAVLMLSAFVEEVIFRGIALTGFTTRFGKNIGNLFVALLYTCLFIPFGSIELGLVMFLASLVYGFAVSKTSKLYGIIGAHFLSALFYYLILPTM